jgi:hypothetical protein
MNKYWLEYVKNCYTLVLESEGEINVILNHDAEAHIVHLMARHFETTAIGNVAIAIRLLEAMNSGRADALISVADECLLIHSYPIRRSKWPTNTYYQEIGITAYGLAGHMMEKHFIPASKVITAIFNKNIKPLTF